MQDQARAMKLPTMLDHEKWFAQTAKLLEGKAKKAKGLEAQRLFDSAIKARRQATQICEWREDWSRTEALESMIKRPRGSPRGDDGAN
jgi:hypothetical protein